MLINEAVETYLSELEILQRSQAHINKTRWHLQKFAAVHGSIEARSVTRLSLARFLTGLHKENGEQYRPASLNGYIAALRGLFGHLAATGVIDKDVSDRLKRKRYRTRETRVASQETLDTIRGKLLDFAACRDYQPVDVRDALVVSLSADSGARRGELHQLNVDDMQQALTRSITANGTAVYHIDSDGKTGQVVLRFFERSAYLFSLWMKLRPETDSPALFVSLSSGKRIHLMTITQAFVRVTEWCGVPRTLSHAIRHRRITEVMQRSDAAVAAKFANHSDPATTLKHYRHLVEDEVDHIAAKTGDRFDSGIRNLFGM